MSGYIEVGCPCGETVIKLSGRPVAEFYCHCTDCQKANAAPYAAVALYPANAFQLVLGAPKSWTLVSIPRSFCPACGAFVFAAPSEEVRGVNALLLPQSAFAPRFHQHCASARLPVKDALPHYRGFPAQFGGSDDEVDW